MNILIAIIFQIVIFCESIVFFNLYQNHYENASNFIDLCGSELVLLIYNDKEIFCMKKYEEPMIQEEIISIEDVVLLSFTNEGHKMTDYDEAI